MNERTNRLVEGFIDHNLSEAELQELKTSIKASPDVGVELANALQFSGLAATMRDSDFGELNRCVAESITELSPAKLEADVMKSIAQMPKAGRKPLAYWALAIAAQIVIVLGLLVFNRPSAINVARVTDSRGEAFLIRNDQKIMLGQGTEVFSGDQIFMEIDSEASLVYDDGSQLFLEDRSYFRVLDEKGAKHIQLYSGMLRGDIEKQQKNRPMLVKTSDSNSTVLGTQFEINTSKAATLLEVNEGTVSIEHVGDGSNVKVGADQYAILRQGGGIDHQKVNAPLYRSPLITKDTPGLGIDIKVDLKGAEKLYLVTLNGGDNNRFDHVSWLSPVLKGKDTLDLTTQQWFLEKNGWKDSVVNGGLDGTLLKSGGKLFEKGVSTHATSVIAYDVPEGYHSFEARAVLLDSGLNQNKSVSSVRFEVYTDPPEDKIQKLLIRRTFF